MTDRNYALAWANGMDFHDLMRLHAHDLAEKIRDNDCGCHEWECSCAADLIDPGEDE